MNKDDIQSAVREGQRPRLLQFTAYGQLENTMLSAMQKLACLCWSQQLFDRPSFEDVLQALAKVAA